MRAFFIAAGIVLINKFHWLIYVFGAFLVYTAFNLAIGKDKEVHPDKNPILKLLRKIMPVENSFSGEAFFIKKMGRYHATPLFAVVLVFGPTDLMFAVDSIPAVLAITRDPFIVYTSNVFALMGLRSIFFALAGLMRIFHYISYGLAVILGFVGAKMLLADVYKISVGLSLGVIATVLLISVIASIIHPHKIEMVIDPAGDPASKAKQERS
jgi:tellurite resistance protein TerC